MQLARGGLHVSHVEQSASERRHDDPVGESGKT